MGKGKIGRGLLIFGIIVIGLFDVLMGAGRLRDTTRHEFFDGRVKVLDHWQHGDSYIVLLEAPDGTKITALEMEEVWLWGLDKAGDGFDGNIYQFVISRDKSPGDYHFLYIGFIPAGKSAAYKRGGISEMEDEAQQRLSSTFGMTYQGLIYVIEYVRMTASQYQAFYGLEYPLPSWYEEFMARGVKFLLPVEDWRDLESLLEWVGVGGVRREWVEAWVDWLAWSIKYS